MKTMAVLCYIAAKIPEIHRPLHPYPAFRDYPAAFVFPFKPEIIMNSRMEIPDFNAVLLNGFEISDLSYKVRLIHPVRILSGIYANRQGVLPLFPADFNLAG